MLSSFLTDAFIVMGVSCHRIGVVPECLLERRASMDRPLRACDGLLNVSKRGTMALMTGS